MASVQPRRTTRASTRSNPNIPPSTSTDLLSLPPTASSSTSRIPQSSSGPIARKTTKMAPASTSTSAAGGSGMATAKGRVAGQGGVTGSVAGRKAVAIAQAARMKANQENLVVGSGSNAIDGEGKGKGKTLPNPSGKPETGKKSTSSASHTHSNTSGPIAQETRRDRAALSEVIVGQQGSRQARAGGAGAGAGSSKSMQAKRLIKPLPGSSAVTGGSISRATTSAMGTVGKGKATGQDASTSTSIATSSAPMARPGMPRRSTRSTTNAASGPTQENADIRSVSNELHANKKDSSEYEEANVGDSAKSATSTTSNGTRRSLKRTLTATASATNVAAIAIKEEEEAVRVRTGKEHEGKSTINVIEPSPKRMRTSSPAMGVEDDREATFDDELALQDEAKVNMKREGGAEVHVDTKAKPEMMDIEEEDETKGEYVIGEDEHPKAAELEDALVGDLLLEHEHEVEGNWVDLDADDVDDPTMVTEYVKDIFAYMRRLEVNTMPNPDYVDSQKELRWEMRGVLMDWIVEVHHKFRLLPETLFLATNLIDRFLSARMVSLPKLQLMGLTCLFIAAKYEEVVCPSVANFLHMADGGYGDDEILAAEKYVLTTLGFDLSYPNPIHFLRRVSKADGFDVDVRTVGKYFIEIACVNHRLLHVQPSLLASAGIYMARVVLDRGPWCETLTHYSTYTEEEVMPTAQLMLDYIISKEIEHECFHKKYASKKYMKASTHVRDWAIANFPQRHHANEGITYGTELIAAYKHRIAFPEEYEEE